MPSPAWQIQPAALSKEMDKLLAAQYREGVDSREQPLYTIRDAAYYLGINRQTLHTWLFGRRYRTKLEPEKTWDRIIVPADPELKLLSFYNLAEAHVLAATRYEHKVPFEAVRDAIKSVEAASPAGSNHPLLSEDFLTEGKHLFVKRISEVVNLSSQQLPLAIMDAFLVRVVRDERGPFKIYPLRPGEPDDRIISIISGVASSRPVIDEGAVPVLAIWRRHKAGEKDDFIARDLDIAEPKVRRAIDYIERRAA